MSSTLSIATNFLSAVMPERVDGEVYRVEVFPRPPVATNNFLSVETMARHLLRFGHRPHNAYFALATFPAGGQDRKAAHALRFGSLWADLDVGNGKPHASKEVAVERARSLGLEPLALVDSGRGIHAYWGFIEPVAPPDHEHFVALLRGLAVALDGDPAATLKSQILRLPGTWNVDSADQRKDGRDFPVRLIELNQDAHRYTLTELEAAGVGPVAAPHRVTPVSGQIPEGQRHRALVVEAMRLRNLGYGAEVIDAALQVINQQRCTEPKPTDEVRQIAWWAAGILPRPLRISTRQGTSSQGGTFHVA